uniref:Uncharacterized protein n=1 Tax=uncultured prokaryote TaxID=198431 RepID=A0A0H5Q322_9ZZZZ|nr:hypothetical protein [uncultured prokaryote]
MVVVITGWFFLIRTSLIIVLALFVRIKILIFALIVAIIKNKQMILTCLRHHRQEKGSADNNSAEPFSLYCHEILSCLPLWAQSLRYRLIRV